MNLASWRLLISLKNLTISTAKGKDKESRKQLKQGSKNTFFFFAFVNLPANMSLTLVFGSKEVHTISSMWGQKMSNNRCPLFTMFYEAKLLNVLHSKLVNNNNKIFLACWVIRSSKDFTFFRKWSRYHGWPDFFEENWSIFTDDLPTHTQSGLFSGETCSRILTLVYFHGRPAHTYLFWSIFMGDQPTHTHFGLFSRATCPHILTLVYFHGRPTLLIGLTWDPIWRSPLTRTNTKMCVWSHCNGWPTQVKDDLIVLGDLPWWKMSSGLIVMGDLPKLRWWSHCDGWPTQKENGLIMMSDLPRWKMWLTWQKDLARKVLTG